MMTIENLEVEDDGPDEAEYDGRTSVNNVSGVDVHQLDLIQIEDDWWLKLNLV